jgi:hypothetical protein
MAMDIDISNIFTKEREKKKEKKEEQVTQIRFYEDIVSLLEVSERIKSSSNVSGYNIVVKYDFIVAREKNGAFETSKTKQKTVILYFNPQSQDHIDFNDFLLQYLTTPKLLVLHVIMSYKLIMESLQYLEQMNIRFSSFSSNNLIFEKKTYKPVITDLEDASMSSTNVAKEVVNELYGNIIQSIIVAFSLENTILNDLLEREKEDMLRKIDKLDRWDFVREMNPSKMKSFHKELLSY